MIFIFQKKLEPINTELNEKQLFVLNLVSQTGEKVSQGLHLSKVCEIKDKLLLIQVGNHIFKM